MMATAHQAHTVRGAASLLRHTAQPQRMAQSDGRLRRHIASVAQSSLPLLVHLRRPGALRSAGKQVHVVLVHGAQLSIERVLRYHGGIGAEAGKATTGVERLVHIEAFVRGQTVRPAMVLLAGRRLWARRRLRQAFVESALVLDERHVVKIANLAVGLSGQLFGFGWHYVVRSGM